MNITSIKLVSAVLGGIALGAISANGATLTVTSTKPTSSIIDSFESDGSQDLRVERFDGDPAPNYRTAGQSFQFANPFTISAVTFRISPDQAGNQVNGDQLFSGGDTLKLYIHEDSTSDGTPDARTPSRPIPEPPSGGPVAAGPKSNYLSIKGHSPKANS